MNAPRVTSCACELTEQGLLFVEARVRYAFEHGGFYEVTFRVLDSDPAIQVDEQFDLKRIGTAYDWQVVYRLAGAGDAGWKPELVFWKTPQGRLRGGAPQS